MNIEIITIVFLNDLWLMPHSIIFIPRCPAINGGLIMVAEYLSRHICTLSSGISFYNFVMKGRRCVGKLMGFGGGFGGIQRCLEARKILVKS
jgi:hypothetical protein